MINEAFFGFEWIGGSRIFKLERLLCSVGHFCPTFDSQGKSVDD
jgi:hypothetical protein